VAPTAPARNLDEDTVRGFGREWTTFDQRALSSEEADAIFAEYFAIFPWESLPAGAVGFDLGCGSGRWAVRVASRVGMLHCIDPSPEALAMARRALSGHENVRFHQASVDAMPLAPGSADFGYALGVLHHVPDTQAGIDACARALKPGAPFLIYLYYALDNRPRWYRGLWRVAEAVRRLISRWPHPAKLTASTIIATTVYLPLARLAGLARRARLPFAEQLPLVYYARRSFYTMRTDAYDRFGTRLEKRFTRLEIAAMLDAAGLQDVRFSEAPPYWCAIGTKTE
jgi:SAM-dependent methyltransferase